MIQSMRYHVLKVVISRFDRKNTIRFGRDLHSINGWLPRSRIQEEIPLAGVTGHKNEYDSFGEENVLQVLDGGEILRRSCFREKLNTLFEQLGKLGDTKTTDTYFMYLQLEGMSNEDIIYLMESYANGLTQRSSDIKSDIVEFQNIIGRLKFTSTRSFDTLIRHCGTHGEWWNIYGCGCLALIAGDAIDLCIELIQSMENYGLQPSANTFEPLIIFFASTLEISKAEDILRVMDGNNIEATMKSYERMIAAYTKAENIEKAYNMIERIPAKELTANFYNPIIHAYGLKGQLRQVLRVFKQIEQKNLLPTADNVSSSILAFASSGRTKNVKKVFKLLGKQKHFTDDDYKAVEAAIGRIYDTKNGKIFHKTNGKALNAKSASPIRNVNRGCAMQISVDTTQIKNWTGRTTFLSSIAASTRGDMNKIFATFQSLRSSGNNGKRSNQGELPCFLCHQIIYPLIRQNELDKALDFVELLKRESTKDVETLCLMVVSLDVTSSTSQEIQLSVEDKFKFLNAMHQRLKVRPTRMVYEYLLQSCLRARKIYIAEQVVQMMVNKFPLNIFTSLILLRVAVSQGDSTKVLGILADMKAMEHAALGDSHVKKIIIQTLKGLRGITINELLSILYPSEYK